MKSCNTHKRTREPFPDDARDCLQALIDKNGVTGIESIDSKALGPIMRLSGHQVDDEKIRNRLKNVEYARYKELHPNWTPAPKKQKRSKVETKPTVKKEKEPSSDNDSNFVVEEGEDRDSEEEEEQQATRSFAARTFNNSNSNAMEIVQPEPIPIFESPRLCEPLDVFGTDAHVWVVAYKTSQRDFKMGVCFFSFLFLCFLLFVFLCVNVSEFFSLLWSLKLFRNPVLFTLEVVDNPNGVGAWPSKVMRITETVHPVTTDIIKRLTNGVEHTFHDKPPEMAMYVCFTGSHFKFFYDAQFIRVVPCSLFW